MSRRSRPRVRCWYCGKRARRVPSTRGLKSYQLTDGKISVVLRKRLLQPYGACGAEIKWYGTCHQPMLKLCDVRYLLRAAIQWDRRGGNTRSEFDVF